MLSGKTLASFGLLGRGIEGEEAKDRSKLMNSEDCWRVSGEAFSRGARELLHVLYRMESRAIEVSRGVLMNRAQVEGVLFSLAKLSKNRKMLGSRDSSNLRFGSLAGLEA